MKHLKQFLSLFVLIVATVWSANATDVLGNQDPKKEKRTTDAPFEQVIVEGNFIVNITYAIRCDIEVDAESNLHEYILTEAKGKTLNVKVAKKVKLVPNMPMTINITMPLITKLQYDGEGEVSLMSVPTSKFEITLSGICKCTMNNVSTTAMKATFSNSCTVLCKDVIGGDTKMVFNDKSTCLLDHFTASKFNLTAATINPIKFDGLSAETLTLTSNSTGAIDFKAMALAKELSAKVTDASVITATGTAPSIVIESTGSGNIDASGVSNEKSKITNNGSATVKVSPTGSLDVVLGKTGSVEYKNRPKIKLENSGSGQLINKNL